MVWGKGGEMTQTLYAHMNKKIIMKRIMAKINEIETKKPYNESTKQNANSLKK
jgi:hypothetical protein